MFPKIQRARILDQAHDGNSGEPQQRTRSEKINGEGGKKNNKFY